MKLGVDGYTTCESKIDIWWGNSTWVNNTPAIFVRYASSTIN